MADNKTDFSQGPAQGGKTDDDKMAVTRQPKAEDRASKVMPAPEVK